ncbi:MAG: porin family protein [Gemmatimonadota bacterium]
MMCSPRSTLLALALTLPIAPLLAQASPTFGLLGGITSSKVAVSGNDVTLSFGSRTGFAAGLSMQFPLGSMLAFEGDVLYAQKGVKLSDAGTTGTIKLAYIEVPLLLRYNLGNGPTRPFILGGASVGFKAGCDVTLDTGDVSASSDCDTIFDGEQKGTDIGATLGAGVAFNRFSIQARYTLGLTEAINDNDDSITNKNRAIFLLAGISF